MRQYFINKFGIAILSCYSFFLKCLIEQSIHHQQDNSLRLQKTHAKMIGRLLHVLLRLIGPTVSWEQTERILARSDLLQAVSKGYQLT